MFKKKMQIVIFLKKGLINEEKFLGTNKYLFSFIKNLVES